MLDRAEAEGLSKNALRAEVIKEKVRLAEELERRQAEWQARQDALAEGEEPEPDAPEP